MGGEATLASLRAKNHVRFDRDDKVQIATDSGRDAFEVRKKYQNTTLRRKQFVQEIRYVTDIIDELQLVDTLYKKQNT